MLQEHLFDEITLRDKIASPLPDSNKGQNGKLLIIGGSPLFHGAGRLSLEAAIETTISFGSKTNDMVYFCSNKENLGLLKERQDVFIGIERSQIDHYLQTADVVLVGPGLMREKEKGRAETNLEPFVTRDLTRKVLKSGKKIVLDAGSLQVIDKNQLQDRPNLIITPHRREMSKLFGIEESELLTSNENPKMCEEVGNKVLEFAKKLNITILLKGPIDIAADKDNWIYIPGGNSGLTKGGTGDVLAGVVAAVYSKIENPLVAAAAGSYITKKAGDKLWVKHKWVYNARDLVNELRDVLTSLLR